jgi:transcriptional regulator with XRE-family HTH domain
LAVEVTITKCLLRDRRRAADLTQEQLAEIIGVKKERISEYERGNINMTVITAKKLAIACKCNIEELFEFKVDRRRG